MKHDDDGLTLIELLIAMSIMLVIMAPLVTSFVISIGTTTRIDQDATNSADAQIFSTYFDSDVANSDSVRTSSSCGAADTILELTWRDGTTNHFVDYQVAEDAAAEASLSAPAVFTLTRLEWVTASTCGGLPNSSTTVVRSAASRPGSLCDGSPCPAVGTPHTVALPIDNLGRRSSELHYQFTVRATRRVSP